MVAITAPIPTRPRPLPSGARLLALAVLTLAVVAAGFLLAPRGPSVVHVGGIGDAAPSPPPPVAASSAQPQTYVVQPGDTVWSIARRLKPEGDVRALVDRIVEQHGGPRLVVGERLDLALPP